MQKPAIGIDLGTTYCCVAYFDPKSKRAEILSNAEGSRTTPSYIGFFGEERCVGENAKNRAIFQPTETIYDVKRLIGRSFSEKSVQDDLKQFPFKVVNVNDRPFVQVGKDNVKYSMEQLSGMMLSNMRQTAENALGRTVTDVVITVPAYFNNAQRTATMDAAKIAGLNVLRLVNEPTAAAMAYGFDKNLTVNDLTAPVVDKPKMILVFDLGGGTLDVSLMEISQGVMEVRATSGHPHLGGEDFDQNLQTFLADQFQRLHRVNVSSNRKAMKRLKIQCERAKKILSTSLTAKIEIDCFSENMDFLYDVSRAKFEELNNELFLKCLEPVDQVLRDAKISKTDVDEIVLIGGSSRIPHIRKILSSYFYGKKLNMTINPDEAVACGAALQCAILLNQGSEATKDILLMDVTPLSLGVENKDGIMDVFIPRNTTVPTDKTLQFTTTTDNQTSALIQIFEGERQFTKDNRLLGQFELTGIQSNSSRNRSGAANIDITFSVDGNGILTVSAVDAFNPTNSNHVRLERGQLSKTQVETFIKDAELYQERDKLMKSRLKKKSEFESVLNTAIAIQRKETFQLVFDSHEQSKFQMIIDDATKFVEEDVTQNYATEVIQKRWREFNHAIEPFTKKMKEYKELQQQEQQQQHSSTPEQPPVDE